ncbi:hypothetical protein [Corynebacterium aquilae]|uniref:hypothetical protein n=1 Tax=Corynebacterium aquilae TaxID=203263 RepID=UPI0009521FB7|nr:hypothetical protein [Corynebacterium aquilae]
MHTTANTPPTSPLGVPHNPQQLGTLAQQRARHLHQRPRTHSTGTRTAYDPHASGAEPPDHNDILNYFQRLPLVERPYIAALLHIDQFRDNPHDFITATITTAATTPAWLRRALDIAQWRGFIHYGPSTNPEHFRYAHPTAIEPLMSAAGIFAPFLRDLDQQLRHIADYANHQADHGNPTELRATLAMYTQVLDSVVHPQRYAQQLLPHCPLTRPINSPGRWEILWQDADDNIADTMHATLPLISAFRQPGWLWAPPQPYAKIRTTDIETLATSCGAYQELIDLRAHGPELYDHAHRAFTEDALTIITHTICHYGGLLPPSEQHLHRARLLIHSRINQLSLTHIHKAIHLAIVWSLAQHHQHLPRAIAEHICQAMDHTRDSWTQTTTPPTTHTHTRTHSHLDLIPTQSQTAQATPPPENALLAPSPGSIDHVLTCLEHTLATVDHPNIIPFTAEKIWASNLDSWYDNYIADTGPLASPLTQEFFRLITGSTADDTPFGRITATVLPEHPQPQPPPNPTTATTDIAAAFAALYTAVDHIDPAPTIFPVDDTQPHDPTDPHVDVIAHCHHARTTRATQLSDARATNHKKDSRTAKTILSALSSIASNHTPTEWKNAAEDIYGSNTNTPAPPTNNPITPETHSLTTRTTRRAAHLYRFILNATRNHQQPHLRDDPDTIIRILAHGLALSSENDGTYIAATILNHLRGHLLPLPTHHPTRYGFGDHLPPTPTGSTPTPPPATNPNTTNSTRFFDHNTITYNPA